MPPRNSTPSNGSRNTYNPRGSGRGGIQKHRTGTPKLDKDGDLLMGVSEGSDARPNGKGRPLGSRLAQSRKSGRGLSQGGPVRNTLASSQAQQAILRGLGLPDSGMNTGARNDGSIRRCRHDTDSQELVVRGLKDSKIATNRDGGLKDLLAFLERKSSGLEAAPRKGVKIKKSRVIGDDVIITTSVEDAAWILKLNTSKFAGTPLTIEHLQTYRTEEGVNMSQEAKKTQDKIREILSIRYDTNLKLLNLSALGKDPGLVQMGMFDAQNRISKLFPVLMVVCDRLFVSAQQKREAIVSVTLADNELDSIAGVTALAQTFPDILNLDLSRNQFQNIHALEGWRWRFRKLQNLKINNNPIETLSPEYKYELVKWYPSLQILNDVQIRTPEEVAIAAQTVAQARKAATASPLPIVGPDFRDVNNIGENFARQFFALYDSDRAALAGLFYDTNSTHSISVNTSAPRSEEHSPMPSWAAYIKLSRNLMKVTTINGRLTRNYQGVEPISLLWCELPATRHPDISTQSMKYLIDCHYVAGLPDPNEIISPGVTGLKLMVHGEFEEKSIDSKIITRSFSRTFLLGPGKAGSPPIRVISDALMLRAWSPLPPLTATDIVASSVIHPGGSGTFEQEETLSNLVMRTQMTPEYAAMCLIETGWDLDKALVAFEASRAKLPPTAFINGT